MQFLIEIIFVVFNLQLLNALFCYSCDPPCLDGGKLVKCKGENVACEVRQLFKIHIPFSIHI
jgi:hypothetical protein